jgi:N-acetyl-anhydromuramyl-L-alanine amidase AmpD
MLPLALLLSGTSILVAGRPIDVGRPVVLWSDPEGFNGYAQDCVEAPSGPCCERTFKRYSDRTGLRERTMSALREVVSQLVLHLDGCVNSRSCFHSMHDLPRPDHGCGLSAHFMVDADGTIYQTLDLLERAWHAEEVNSISVGIEICNRGQVNRAELDRLPRDYRTRPSRTVVINGRPIQAYEFRPAQYEAVLALSRTLVRIFPKVKPVMPEQDGQPLLATLRDPLGFAGILGHLHVDLQRHKWDPGAFDWRWLLEKLSALRFPFPARSYATVDASSPAGLAAHYRLAEERASAFFPMSPGRLWHGGVHLRGIAEEPVYAPARGRVVAARIGEHEGSSTSFVLIRHDLRVGEDTITFYSLLLHLAAEPISFESRVGWLRELVQEGNQTALEALREGRVALIDGRVEAGDVIGRVGVVHRAGEHGPEVHFEIFSPNRYADALGRTFQFLDGEIDGPFVKRGAILDAMGAAGKTPSATDLKAFFRDGELDRREALRHLAVRRPHEWGDRTTADAYVMAPELRALPADLRQKLYDETVAPYTFWTDALAAHAGLPESQVVYFYHPLTFLGALAAAIAQTPGPTRGPRVVVYADRDVESAPLDAGPFRDWLATPPPRASDAGPIFGEVVGAEASPRRKSEIPLIVLPSKGDF